MTTGRVVDAMAGDRAAGAAIGLFVSGHILGVVLARRRTVERPRSTGMGRRDPYRVPALHLIFAVIMPNSALDAAVWILTAIGFAAAGLALARTSPARPEAATT